MFVATINKNLKSYVFAILGAEYILRWLPIGTHDWDKFLTPEELENITKKKNNISIEIDNLFPIIRKHLSYKNSKGDYIKWVLNFKQDKNILLYLNHFKLREFSQKGPVTPDNVIRIKPKP